jgi:segregation and condensation protein B
VTDDLHQHGEGTEFDQLVASGIVSDSHDVDQAELMALLEALLLVTPEPAEIHDLVEATALPAVAIEQALTTMGNDARRGWVVVRHGSTVHLASAPRFATVVRRFLRLDRQAKLSGASLETLALIAYRQPVTRAEIEALRGVDCSGVLATLHARGLIEIGNKLPTVGNPNQYVTSAEFLMQFGLTSLNDLPALEEFRNHVSLEETPGITIARPASSTADPRASSPI